MRKTIGGVKVKYIAIAGVVGGAAFIAAVIIMKHRKGAASSATTVITGSTSSNTGISASMLQAILRDWQQHPPASSSSSSTGGKKPKPKPKRKPKSSLVPSGKPPVIGGGDHNRKTSTSYTEYTVKPGQTLDEIARQFGITPAQLAHSNVYVPGEAGPDQVGQTLGTGAGLKTGQKLRIPHYHRTG